MDGNSQQERTDVECECFCLLNEASDLLKEALVKMHDHRLPGRGRAANAINEADEAIAVLEAQLKLRGAL